MSSTGGRFTAHANALLIVRYYSILLLQTKTEGYILFFVFISSYYSCQDLISLGNLISLT